MTTKTKTKRTRGKQRYTLVAVCEGGLLRGIYAHPTIAARTTRVVLIDYDDKEAEGWSAKRIENYIVKLTENKVDIY